MRLGLSLYLTVVILGVATEMSDSMREGGNWHPMEGFDALLQLSLRLGWTELPSAPVERAAIDLIGLSQTMRAAYVQLIDLASRKDLRITLNVSKYSQEIVSATWIGSKEGLPDGGGKTGPLPGAV